MIVHTLAVGLNDQQTKRQERPNDYYLNVVYTETASRFDGATVTPVHGVYKHLNGETVVENTIKIELLLPDSREQFANTLTHELGHVAMHISQFEYIDPYSEELAYLLGDLFFNAYRVAHTYLCPSCGGRKEN